MAVLQTGLAKSLAEDYTIDQSLRFESDDSAFLSRTPGSAGNTTQWTFSAWLKIGEAGFGGGNVFSACQGSDVQPRAEFIFSTGGALTIHMSGVTGSCNVVTTQLFRDPGAWYHLVLVCDTPNATEADRIIFYVNGSRVTDFSSETYPTQSGVTPYNNTYNHELGNYAVTGASSYYDGYMAEVYWIDGTAYAASDFGETDSTTNQWKPIDAVDDLTFGTNGFYQKYASTELANSFFDSGNGGRHVVTANGGAHTDTAVKKFGTASAQFDGVGDFLSIPDSSDFDFGTSTDFTIDFWFRCPTQVDSYPSVMGSGTATWSTNSNAVRIGPNGDLTKLEFYHYSGNGASPMLTSTTSVNDSTWRHGAIVRSRSTWYLFINGTKEDTYTGTNPDTDLSDNGYFYIGKNGWDAGGGEYIGYIDELRVSNVSRWTADFDEPTEALTNDINTMLLLHCDGSNDGTSFPDSATPIIYDRNGVVNTRAEQKVGDSSIVLDGSNDYLETPDNPHFSFTDDFTIECWINFPDDSITSARFLAKDRAGNRQFSFALNSGQLAFYMYDSGSNAFGRTSAILNPASENTWYHVAMVYDKSAGTLKMFVDGVEDTSAGTVGSDLTYNVTSTTAWLEIGRGYDGSY